MLVKCGIRIDKIRAMNLHQLRFVREAVRQNFNLTDAAKALFTSQPGVSKAIIELEEELGVDIFTRHGKRIRGLTEPGRLVLQSVELIMQEIDSLKRIGKEYAAQDSGSFTIATTHTQARYMLPKVVQAFMQRSRRCACRCCRATRARSPTWSRTTRPTWPSPPNRSPPSTA
jgi:DNA-binding transcriptional LysR family regulator